MAQFAHRLTIELLLPIWKGKAIHGTVDYLEAYRLEFHYRIAAQVQRNCVSKLWKLYLVCKNMVDTPSLIVVSTDWLLIA